MCGPRGQQFKCRRVLKDFEDDKMHALVVEDGGKKWEALHKELERSGARYHRVPAPGGKAVIITTAELGTVVMDPEPFVRQVVANQPWCPQDKRRMTSSTTVEGCGRRCPSPVEAGGDHPHGPGTADGGVRRGGRDPTEVVEAYLPPDSVAAHDVRLPEPGSAKMSQLARRLELERDDPAPEGTNAWGRAVWVMGVGEVQPGGVLAG